MVAFFDVTLVSAEEEKAQLSRELLSRCQHLAHLTVPSLSEPTEQTLVPRSGESCVSGENPQAPRVAMEELPSHVLEVMQKVELHEQVEELDPVCTQLSGEIDTTAEYIALYKIRGQS
ncbi:Golgin subfamily A member 2 [Sciurus carolinensis]|uniref:Golgin subfamily A member 2 n=1 Tax=Sciurus carolinensis TaxID=30640 RepID=A0AA41T035_SCICA|nr:Golgin subfamily A member 2 [Sciurus carolinensis]